MANNHCVFFRSDLRFDGRISSIIRTLANSYPDDEVYLFEFVYNQYEFDELPSNAVFVRRKLLFGHGKSTPLKRLLLYIEYALKAFVFLIIKRPKTIQVHSEIVSLGPLLYKLLFKKNKLVYNDLELYHPRDKNIPKWLYKIEYMLIDRSELVIITNEYRKRALLNLHKNKIKDYIIVDNYVFNPDILELDSNTISKLDDIKKRDINIILHQGSISNDRGWVLLINSLKYLPESWIMVFIGVKDAVFNEFKEECKDTLADKIINFGYIPYTHLNSFYQHVDAAILFYDSSTFNNKYCAPNRLYSPVNNGIPIIINADNGTLSDFIRIYHNGVMIPDYNNINDFFQNYNEYKRNSDLLKGKYEYKENINALKEYYF